MSEVVILLGSNIDERENIRRGARLLADKLPVMQTSSVWKTPAVGSTGPDFYNAAMVCTTDLNAEDLKHQVLRPIEDQLGRIRSENKFADRTIDLDVVIINNEILEPRLWDTAFILLPVAQLMPDLHHPGSGISLQTLANEIKTKSAAIMLTDFELLTKLE